MWFWWFMCVCVLIIPMILIVGGRMMWKHCPKKINGIYGYRTARSMKNMDTWKFAHEYCGRLWWKMGLIMLVPTIVIQIPFFHSSEDVVSIVGMILSAVQILALMVSAFSTEAALKRTFFEDGTRR